MTHLNRKSKIENRKFTRSALNIALVNPPSVVSLPEFCVPHGCAMNDMMLPNLLSAEQIIPEMKASERWQAIEEIVTLLVEAGRISDKDKPDVLAALKQREETMSTGIGFGIAIPHASSDCVTEVVAGFGRSREGIEFDSLDNKPVHFIVLFIVPRDQFQTHLRTLAAIAKFLNDRAVRDELGSATTAQDILKVFSNRSVRG